MPTATNRQLTLTTVGLNTTVNVKYDANFSVLERHLAGLGLIFKERIAVIGVDALPGNPFAGTVVGNFPGANIPVTDGTTAQTIARNVSITVTRASLQEDTAAGDNDEIRCRIRIQAVGLPPEVTDDEFTDKETLVG